MISKDKVEQLYGFIGYGRLKGRLWFPSAPLRALRLGREEGLGRHPRRAGSSLEWELSTRADWQEVMDARKAHELLQDPYWEDSSG